MKRKGKREKEKERGKMRRKGQREKEKERGKMKRNLKNRRKLVPL